MSKNRFHSFVLSLALLFGLAAAAHAAPAAPSPDRIFLSTDQLAKMGIPPQRLGVGVLSRDGTLLVNSEREVDPKLKAQGKVFKLQIMHLDWAQQKVTMDTIPLPTTDLNQFALSPDNKTLVAIGDAGTSFMAVDVASQKARLIFKHEKGKPGFRSLPQVEWFENGRFYTVGYFYDADEVATGDAIASIDPSKSGLDAIAKEKDIAAIMRRNANYMVAQWYDSNLFYIGGLHREDKKIHLQAFMGGAEVPVDVAMAYGSLAVGADRLVYAARWEKERRGVVVMDLAQKRKWNIGNPLSTYGYLYMSADGATILVTEFFRMNGEMTVYFAREAESWKLRPVPGVEKVPMGVVRFSPGGQVVAFYNTSGLLFTRLPK